VGHVLSNDLEIQAKFKPNPISQIDLRAAEVLIIEDEDLMSALMNRYIQQFCQERAKTFHTLRLDTGWNLLTSDLSSVKIAVVDILLPQVNGADLIRHFRAHYPNMGIVPVTGMATSQLQRQIKESLPEGFEILDKPLRKAAFFEAFNKAYEFGAKFQGKVVSKPKAVEIADGEPVWSSAVAPSVPTAQFKKKVPGRPKIA
jgi:DNA-binding NarL/FixJ family response regulator